MYPTLIQMRGRAVIEIVFDFEADTAADIDNAFNEALRKEVSVLDHPSGKSYIPVIRKEWMYKADNSF